MDVARSDVVVVGAGNAAMCAALSARENGASVTVLECAPKDARGGNSAFTAGAMRVVYNGVDDLLPLVPDLSEADAAGTDFGSYPAERFYDDMARVTQYRADPQLVELLVEKSYPTLRWMRDKGVRFLPIYGRQAFKVDGKFTFWGGLTIEAVGGGPGLVDALANACEAAGIPILYDTRAVRLVHGDGGVEGVEVRSRGATRVIVASAVVLASGGFQANPEWRTRYLGPGWDLAKVRGSRFNTGDGIRMAVDIGASTAGHWSGSHAVQWDRNAPEFGDLTVGDGFQKHSYPFAIVVNEDGQRFIDEGADFRNYTYAKYGQEVLKQPNQVAWQVFDAKSAPLMRDEYRIRQVTKVQAETLPQLAAKMDGVSAEGFLATVEEFNASIDRSVPFDPNVKDGRRTRGLPVPKSNWAAAIDEPPFQAFQVTCGITFTFGGLRITPQAEVLDADGGPIHGLYACGELVGGLFYFNYPGGTGLTAGSVIGKIAGESAARVISARE
jgi:tricarballylate dehydrogenase